MAQAFFVLLRPLFLIIKRPARPTPVCLNSISAYYLFLGKEAILRFAVTALKRNQVTQSLTIFFAALIKPGILLFCDIQAFNIVLPSCIV
jgi:hypothetical protein